MNLEEVVKQLREDVKGVHGAYAVYVGDLRSAYKKAIEALEEVQEKLASPPAEDERVEIANPNCFGFGKDNVIECGCRQVFLRKNRT